MEINQSLKLYVSDPWDFGTENGCGPFFCKIISMKCDAIVVQLNQSLKYKDTTVIFLLRTARHHGMNLELIEKGYCVPCNFIILSPEIIKTSDPYNVNWCRNFRDIGLIGDIQSS